MIKCELVQQNWLLKNLISSILRKKNMQIPISGLDLQAPLYTENKHIKSKICNRHKKFFSYICYFRKFDITGECFLGEMLHRFVSL